MADIKTQTARVSLDGNRADCVSVPEAGKSAAGIASSQVPAAPVCFGDIIADALGAELGETMYRAATDPAGGMKPPTDRVLRVITPPGEDHRDLPPAKPTQVAAMTAAVQRVGQQARKQRKAS